MISLRFVLVIFCYHLVLRMPVEVHGMHNIRHQLKQGAFGMSKSLKNGGLFPSVFNVAAKAEIFVNATCGEDGPESFCKPSESSRCAICDARSPDPGKRHNINQALDSNPSRWWQSPTLARGDDYEFVTIILDLKQVYQVEYVIVKAANSPRPAAWILERSQDGENFEAWQYYAPNDEECWTRYSMPPVAGKPIYSRDDEVICTSQYSRPTPMENGEIHTHLVNGRPGAVNHTESIQEFTEARFVRFRFRGFGPLSEAIPDKRRAFYSIREINIGGRCLCSGHAARCRYSAHHKHQECECERHTCGERCEKCCPMYNQVQWKPGTSGKGFHCERCNCNRHATSCQFDPQVAEEKLSLDIRGKYRGGGVCQNCTDHTTGINCEKCEAGFYRPNGVLPDAPEPCVPCDCDIHGSTGFCTPDDSFVHVGKVAGSCECKVGYSGHKCDQCAAGFRQFPDCVPCPCNSRGILPSHDCEGDCICKANVEGEFCDRCKPGFYSLSRENVDGCISCDCFGVSNDCNAARLTYSMISSLDGWLVTDLNASDTVAPSVNEHGWPTIAAFEVEYRSPYWLAPKIYTGNHLSSYGSNITYTVSWVIMRGDTSGKATSEPNIVLIGNNGMRIAYGEESYTGGEVEISVPLFEQGWYHVKVRSTIHEGPMRVRRTEYRGSPVTKSQMIRILANVKYVLIRARYHSDQFEGSLHSAILAMGEVSLKSGKDSVVEMCTCPPGYSGLSCESCDWGYVQVETNNSIHGDFHECVKCDCNGHSSSCNLMMGECSTCEHNTVGPKCDRCAVGFYGDATIGTTQDCKRCACPLTTPPNNFSPNCQLDNPNNADGAYVCTQCPVGYTGDHCESCDFGYFGFPTTPGGTCQPCPCYGGPCDPNNGRCLECRGNTEGWSCEKCKQAHYGNPLEQNCQACECDPLGSTSDLCDPESGQCPCQMLFEGRDCSFCVEGYGNVTAGCIECDCGMGAKQDQCDPITGACTCNFGVVGTRCDQCDIDHFGLSSTGCTSCHCNMFGSNSSTCDIVSGQCHCKPHVMGRKCDRCKPGFWGLVSGAGCAPCGCDLLGSYNSSCADETGQCFCKPGVGGLHCDTCLPGHYGFSRNGCRACDECDRPGHICDPDTGRCICPRLTFGENCDRCLPGSYGLRPGIGCTSCSCAKGSAKQQCLPDGQCECREGFTGLRCEQCSKGYYGYPLCRPCSCNVDGTLQCSEDTSDLCNCDNTGQCPCKNEVTGKKCDQCVKGTFGLDAENPKGCTECFCFGRSTKCIQGGLSWGQRRIPRPRTLYINDTIDDVVISNFGSSNILPYYASGLNKTNGLHVIPGKDGDITLPLTFYRECPLYWQMPDSFLGDKVVSYGGFLRFAIEAEGGYPLRSSHRFPFVQLQGNNKVVLEHYPQVPSTDNHYVVRFHESMWRLRNRPEFQVTREILMVALQNLQHIFIKASENSDFTSVTLLEVSMDVAVLSTSHSPPMAKGVEICQCPEEYNGTSCQDPANGYYRSTETNVTITSTIVIDLVGHAKPCQCNGRSEICNKETGHCLSCRNNTAGPYCDVCAESFYGDPNYGGCRSCPCPHADKKFSNTCIISEDNEVVCVCKRGYTGPKCEQCAYSYYGYPTLPGGSCAPCNCNSAGSSSDDCEPNTGQCICRPGSTGRDCSKCTADRHVLQGGYCTSCNDNCTGLLLDDLEDLDVELTEHTSQMEKEHIPPPWEELSLISSNMTYFYDELNAREELREKLELVPWHIYQTMQNDAEILWKAMIETTSDANMLKSRTGDLQNNVYNLLMTLNDIRSQINGSIGDLLYYSHNDRKIGVKKALQEARLVLDDMSLVDLSKRSQMFKDIIDECTGYMHWMTNLDDPMEFIEKATEESQNFSMKLDDLAQHIEVSMDKMFTFEGLNNEINKSSEYLKTQLDKLDEAYAESDGRINEGEALVEDAQTCVSEAQNNFQVTLPDLTKKLKFWSEKVAEKEESLYTLNYEYKQKYVIGAIAHALNLSEFVDQYVGLFAETRNEAANPLKAAQVYQNIVDGISTAKTAALEATATADRVNNQVHIHGREGKPLLNTSEEVVNMAQEQWDRSNQLNEPISEARNKLDQLKFEVMLVKDSLNSTGTKDNRINIKLRELQSEGNIVHDQLDQRKIEADRITSSISNTRRLINDYKEGIANVLKPKLHELKRESDSKISLASEKLTDAQSNIKRADAKIKSLSIASIRRQIEFDKWNGSLASKLQSLKDKITEARNAANGIRVSMKSAKGKKCVRSYRSENLQPSTTTTILMTLAVPHHQREGILFFLSSSSNDDFVALEMYDRKIRFLWNVGGGTGVITHPEVLESGNLGDNSHWYHIEVERIRHVAKLTVRKQSSRHGKPIQAMNLTNTEFGRFDVTSLDWVWIGGVHELQQKPAELLSSNGLPGCVHKVILDGKPIGLWNFITSASDNACEACAEGPQEIRSERTYSFNGEGYAVRNQLFSGPYDKYVFGVSLNFRTFDENALLFLAIDPENPTGHLMLSLREGRVILQIAYEGNITLEMSSMFTYNNGNWTRIDAFRQYQLGNNIEQCSFSINGESDIKIGGPTPQPNEEDIPDMADAKFYIGGVPPSFRAPDRLVLPSQVSFLGCMSNIFVQEGYDPMAGTYYGVESSCSNKPIRIVGFEGDGYLEHDGMTLRKISSSISFSFRTLQKDAVLLLSTFSGLEARHKRESTKDLHITKEHYYSAALLDGQVQIRLNAGKGELLLQTNNTFNDGKYHTVTITKKRKEVELRIDDAYQKSHRLPSSTAIKSSEFGGLYFGGLPAPINNTRMIGTVTPLKGAIKEAIFNDVILRFNDAVAFHHALIGHSGPDMGVDPPMYELSAPLSRGMSTQPEGCQKVPYYSLETGALKFGDKPQSHTQLYLNFENFWDHEKKIEFDFRTYYPNGLLFITPGFRQKNYLAVLIRDGQLSLLVKSKQKKEILFKTPFNDGSWHHVVITHGTKKLNLSVDSQSTKSIKVPKKIGLTNVMYIGGIPESGTPLPEQIVSKLQTLKGCIKGLRVNGNVYDMVGSTSRPYNVGQCFPNVESGAYFQGDAYAVYKNNFELGAILELQLEFRTSEMSGVLLLITTEDGSPALSLEVKDGKIIMAGDYGDNPLFVEQHFDNPYAVCDNRWHRIQAIFNDEELALKVDELDQKYGLPAVANANFMESPIKTTVYIGGLPATASNGTLSTRDHFNGCIRNVMIAGERRDWTDMAELHNIHLSSCPVQ